MINERDGVSVAIGADLTNSNECKKVINCATKCGVELIFWTII